MGKTHKGSWSRVHNHRNFRGNYDAIFRRKQVDDVEEMTPEEAQAMAEYRSDVLRDDAVDKWIPPHALTD